MTYSKDDMIKWVKSHKKQLAAVGISAIAVVALILAIKNREALANIMKNIVASVSKPANTVTSQSASAVKAGSYAQVTDIAKAVSEPVQSITTSAQIDKIPFDVHKHVRNLPDGYHASPEKVATALENGIELLNNQTWVVNYTKGLPIAG